MDETKQGRVPVTTYFPWTTGLFSIYSSLSPPPHAVTHLVNAHLLPAHGSGGNNFSLVGGSGLSPSNHDDLSAGVPLTISTTNSQQQQLLHPQQQQSTRAFNASASTSALHLAVPHSSSSSSSSVTPSLLYVGGNGASGNGNRVMNLSTEQDAPQDYITANLPNLSPIR